MATLVDFAPSKDGQEHGAVLEVFDAVGNTIAVVIVPDNQVEPLHAGGVLYVRSKINAGYSNLTIRLQ